MKVSENRYYLAWLKEPRIGSGLRKDLLTNNCEMLGLAPGVTLETFFHNYGHYYRELVGPFRSPRIAMLACLKANTKFTVGEIEREYARLFDRDRRIIEEDYRFHWRGGGRMIRVKEKFKPYTGKIEDFGKR